MDSKGQASAEFILLFGGIIVVVLLAVYLYNIYVSDLGSQISSREITEFNGEIDNLYKYFK